MGFKQPENIPVGKDFYKLTRDYMYYINPCFRVKILHGIIWDGASIPKLFYWFLRRDGKIRAASLVHDAIYSNSHLMDIQYLSVEVWRSRPEPFSRDTADQLFYNLMIEAGIPKWKANIAHKCVRIFGKKHWKGLPELA